MIVIKTQNEKIVFNPLIVYRCGEQIRCAWSETNYDNMGSYLSKERAQEVIDEFYEWLAENSGKQTTLYELPKE